MKLKNSLWAKLQLRFPNLSFYAAKKEANNKTESLAGSVVDKRVPVFKPLILLLPAIFVLTLFTIIPFFLNIKYAFTYEKSPGHPSTTTFTMDGFKNVFESPTFGVAVRNSIMYGLIVLPFVMAISLIISSCIATAYRKWARGIWQTIFFLPYITNIVAVSLSFIQFFSTFGMFNSMFHIQVSWLETGDIYSFRPLLPMIIQGVWSGLAFNILISTTAMLSVDKNLYKSASIDGIGGIKQFFHITLPSIKSTTTFLITMGIIGGIKVFPLALFNNKPSDAISNGASTLMLFIYERTNVGSGAVQVASAAAICLFIIGILYSTLIRGGFGTIMKVSKNYKKNYVWNKIKNSEVMKEYQAKKK